MCPSNIQGFVGGVAKELVETTDHGPRSTGHGSRTTVHGARSTGHGRVQGLA